MSGGGEGITAVREGRGVRLPFFNEAAQAGRHILQLVGGIILMTVSAVSLYFVFDGRILAADDKAKAAKEFSEENKKTVKEVDRKIDSVKDSVSQIQAKQMLQEQSMEFESRNNAAFQVRTDTALDRVLQKLDDIYKNR
jgi:hypothetical protein